MTTFIDSVIQHYGYLAIFALVFAESVGLPVPGETALIAGAVFAGTTHRLDIAAIAAIATTAAVLGDNLGFLLGRRYGPTLISRFGQRLRLTPGMLAMTEQLFARHGAKVVGFGRFVSLLRTWAAFLAGLNRMPWRRFLIANATGGLAWAIAWSVAGYYLGAGASRFGHWATIIGIAVSIALAVVTMRFTRRRFAELETAALADGDRGQPKSAAVVSISSANVGGE